MKRPHAFPTALLLAPLAGDALLIEVLRADNSVLASTTNAPGAWTGKMTFTPANFEYKGDGSGDVRLRIGRPRQRTAGASTGRSTISR